MKQLFPLDPSRYERHFIHAQDRTWIETNCYADVWIELLHSWGFDPVAALPFTIAIDFEGDQWTFFKFPHSHLYDLYGLDVQELLIWRPIIEHVEEQLDLGRIVLVEADSYYLPDTAGSAYKIEHTKSTIAINEIDLEAGRLGYFHNQGYFHVGGEDFAQLFHLRGVKDESYLPPYVEFVKRRSASTPRGDELTGASLQLLQRHLRGLPDNNPFIRFKNRFMADLEWLVEEPLATFHKYSFGTLRQFGACYELATTYLKWLKDRHVKHLERPILAFDSLSTGAKTLQFHLARAISRKRGLDLSSLDEMTTQWQVAIDALKEAHL
jgi:hypothetical protein